MWLHSSPSSAHTCTFYHPHTLCYACQYSLQSNKNHFNSGSDLILPPLCHAVFLLNIWSLWTLWHINIFIIKNFLVFSSHYYSMCRYQISVSSDCIMPYCLIFKNPYWVTDLSFPHITKIIQEHFVLGWDRIFNNFPSSTVISYPQLFIKCLGLCEDFPFTLACQQVRSCHMS